MLLSRIKTLNHEVGIFVIEREEKYWSSKRLIRVASRISCCTEWSDYRFMLIFAPILQNIKRELVVQLRTSPMSVYARNTIISKSNCLLTPRRSPLNMVLFYSWRAQVCMHESGTHERIIVGVSTSAIFHLATEWASPFLQRSKHKTNLRHVTTTFFIGILRQEHPPISHSCLSHSCWLVLALVPLKSITPPHAVATER